MPEVVPFIYDFLQAVGLFAAQYLPEVLLAGLMLVTGALGMLVPFSVAMLLDKVAPPYAVQGYAVLCATLLLGLGCFELVRRARLRRQGVAHA